MLHGTEPNTVGGLAHWIQTVYWESSSSDDTMWAACSSQNTNVPCESKKKEKKWVFHRNNLVNTVATQRERTPVLYQSSGTERFDHCRGHIWSSANWVLSLQRWRNAPWVRQETAKSVTNKMWVDNRKQEKVNSGALRWFSSDWRQTRVG